jgi:uncharacterized membrane protein YfcA
MDNLPLFIFLALIAETLGTIGGFGSSMLFVPIASFFLDFHSVLGVTALFHISSNSFKLILFRKGFDRKIIIYLGVPAVIAVIPGAYAAGFIGSKWLEIVLGCVLIILSTTLFITHLKELSKPKITLITGGTISGFMAGLLGTGGAIRGVILSAFNLTTESFIATSAAIDLMIDSGRAITYFLNGFIHLDDLYLVPILIGVSFAGTYAGKFILEKIPKEKFRIIVLSMVLITGVVTLLKAFDLFSLTS